MSTALTILFSVHSSTSPEDCALMFNASDPLRDAILLEEDQDEVDSEPCIMTGHLAKSVNWFGYLATFKFRASGGRVYYRFVYPEDRCCIKIIFYLEEQVLGLRARMNCLQKQSMVDPGSRQVILLSPSDTSAGCVSNKTDNGVRVIECTSGRVLKSNEDRAWYIAASSCGSPTGLDLQYSFVAYGHKGKCPEPTTTSGTAALHSSASRRPLSVPCDDSTARFLLIGAGALWSLWCHLLSWDAVR